MHPTSRRKNRNKRNKHVVQNNFHSGNQNNATGKDENLFEERRDSELFFFDIAGNKYDLDRVPPYISKKRPINRLQQNTTKNFNFRHNRNKKKKNKLLRKVNPETSITSEADTIKNVNNNLRDVNIIKVPRKKKKRKKHKLNELEDIEIYNARYNVTDFGTQTESNLDKNTTTSSGLPFNAKENKEKNIDASIDIRNSDCEVMNYSISGNKRRDKKVDKAGQNDSIKETTLKDNAKHSNSEMYNSHENHVSEMFLENDNPNYDLLEKCNRENNALLNYNSNNLHVNGGDHLNHFSSSRKKKKKKDYLQSADEQDIVTPSASFKPSYLIDIRDSDCEVSTEVVDTEVLIPLKKKKKKHRVNECTAGFISECKTELDNMNCNNREIKKGTLLDNDSFNNVALNDRTKLSSDERKIIDLIKGDILFSFKKKKKKRSPQKETCDVNSDELTYGKHNGVYNSFNNGTSTEQDSTEPDIDNECEMMIINDSHKKKKDNRTRPGHTNKDDSVAKKDWKNDSFITDIKVINKANVSEDAEIQRTFVTNHSPDSRIKRKNKKHKIDSIEIDSDLEDITLASIDLDSSSNASDLSKSNTSRSVLESMHNAANSFPDSCNEDDHRSNDTGKKKKRGLQNESSELEAISTPKKKHKKPSNDNVRTEDSEIHLLVDIRDSECEMTTSYYNSNSKKPKKNKSKVNDSTTAFNNSTANLQKEQFEAVRREKYKKKKTNRHSEKNIFSGLDNNEDNSERTLKPQRDRDADDLEEIMNPGIDVFSSLEEGIADGVDKENNGMVTFCNSDGKRKKKKDRYNLEDDNQNKNDLEEISQTEDKKSIRKNHKPKDNRVYNKVTDDHDCDKGKVVSGNDKFIGKINDDSVEDRISENSEKCKRKRQGEKHWQLLGNEEQANEDLHQSDSFNEDDHRSNNIGKRRKRGLQNESLELINTPKKKRKKASNNVQKSEDSEIDLIDVRDSECEMTSYYNSNSKKSKKNKSAVDDNTTELNSNNPQNEPFKAVGSETYKKKERNRHVEKNQFSDLDNKCCDRIENNSERTPKKQRDRYMDTDDLGIENAQIDLSSSFKEEIVDIVDKEDNEMVIVCNSNGKRETKKNSYELEDDHRDKNDVEKISQVEDKKGARKKHKLKDKVCNKVSDENNCDNGKVFSNKCIGKTEDDSVEDGISENSEKRKRRKRAKEHSLLVDNEEQANRDLHQSDSISTTDVDEATPCDESGKTNINAASASSWLSEDEETEFEEEVYKWRRLPIVLPFTVCPLHAILTRASYPTKEQSEEIIKRNLEVKNGPFSQAEDEKILGNWKRFCEEYNFKMIPKAFIPFPRGVNPDQRLIFLRYISHGLDNRLIHRVYRRFKLIMSKDKLKLGRFTPEEDHQILEYMKNTTSPHPFSDLSKSLSRTNNSLFKRYRRLILAKHETVHWKPGLIKPFLKHLKKITKCSDLNDLQYRKVSVKEWRKLSKKMVPIPMWKLQLAWESYIYPRLFIDETVDMKEIKAKIIKRLIKRNESDWRAVDWRKITKKFPGFTSTKIYNMFKQLVIFHVPKEKQKNLKECLNFLEEKLLKSNKIPTTHPFKKIKHEMNDE